MVTVTSYERRTAKSGKDYFLLTVEGDIEFKTTDNGSTFINRRRALIATMLDEDSVKLIVGTQLKGEIQKVECEPYQIEKSNGEITTLNHRYQFIPQDELDPVKIEAKLNSFSTNGMPS